MLIGLGIRDVVLIEALDLSIGPGLTALTGETGAGKSIILDALGLAVGARADAGLVRRGSSQAVATAIFALTPGHAAWAYLDEKGLSYERDEDLVLRRSLGADGRSRAFVNDQLAGKEMNIGRFRNVIDRYQTTSHTPEALYRLVEAYLTLGLVEEAKRNGAVLGANYASDRWYHDAYRLLTNSGLTPAEAPRDPDDPSGFVPHLDFHTTVLMATGNLMFTMMGQPVHDVLRTQLDRDRVARSEWDAEQLTEQPYSVERTLRTFEEANARLS